MLFSLVLTAMALTTSERLAPCPEGPDLDRDGLSDMCELQLAAEFAPILVVSVAACNWNPVSGRLDGAYLFGVHPRGGGIRVTYLPAYLVDCGWKGPKCLLRWRGGCDPHRADSEFISVDLAYDSAGATWAPRRVFLSAHCFGNSSSDCRWHEAEDFVWLGTHSFVWVAEGKNANYTSAGACDSGHWHFDTCDRNDRSYYFPVESLAQDIGSPTHPFPHHVTDPSCVSSTEVPLLPELPGSECIWSDEAFRGWSGAGEKGVTPYRRYFVEVAELTMTP
jgi:hypothetical protein